MLKSDRARKFIRLETGLYPGREWRGREGEVRQDVEEGSNAPRRWRGKKNEREGEAMEERDM
jgi:hypothetical protein